MKKNGRHNNIIQERLKAILALIKDGKDVFALEREVAFLALDAIEALRKKEITFQKAHVPFVKIEYAIDQKLNARLSEEAKDLLNEAIILDEIGTPHGPDMNLLITLATKLVSGSKQLLQAEARSFALSPTGKEVLEQQQKINHHAGSL
jgi:hypothetical protein